MKKEIDRLYLIDKYFRGELTGLALDEFKTKVRQEPEFAKEVESHRAIVEGIKLARIEYLRSVLKGEIPPAAISDEVKEVVDDVDDALKIKPIMKKVVPPGTDLDLNIQPLKPVEDERRSSFAQKEDITKEEKETLNSDKSDDGAKTKPEIISETEVEKNAVTDDGSQDNKNKPEVQNEEDSVESSGEQSESPEVEASAEDDTRENVLSEEENKGTSTDMDSDKILKDQKIQPEAIRNEKAEEPKNEEEDMEVEEDEEMIDLAEEDTGEKVDKTVTEEPFKPKVTHLSGSFENTYRTPPELNETIKPSGNKFRINSNNWYYAAAAVLFAGFLMYYIFGYYLPSSKLANHEVISDSSETPVVKQPVKTDTPKEEDIPVVVDQNLVTPDTLDNSSNDVVQDNSSDSAEMETDKLVKETFYMAPKYETVGDDFTGNDNNRVSTGNGEKGSTVLPFIKKSGQNIKVQYWISAVGFDGYKFEDNTVQLFDVKPTDNVSLNFVDDILYMRRSGLVYRLAKTGNFEHYKKVSNTDILKLLEIK